MLSHRVVLLLVPASLVSVPASAQSVVSAHSGVIHYSEGAVFVDDQRIEQKFGKFCDIKPGSELRTQNGRAEILLTPGMFLRVGENSAIRMLSNRLIDTRVEFLSGSVVVESVKAAPGTSVVMVYKDSEVRFRAPGLYRFDSEPPELRVDQGEADVLAQGQSVAVKQAHVFPFSSTAAISRFNPDTDDALDSWSRKRSVSVAASDATAAQAEDMAVFLDSSQNDPFALAPLYGVSPYIPTIGGYGYLGVGPWSSPYYLPRLGYYNVPFYSGYAGYRSGYRPFTPIRTVTPGLFHPPARVYNPVTSRPVTVSPGVSHAGGRLGGHR